MSERTVKRFRIPTKNGFAALADDILEIIDESDQLLYKSLGGIDIYEGDIIQTEEDYIYEIQFDGFKIVCVEKEGDKIISTASLEDVFYNTNFWIVGNIHQGIDKSKLR